LCVMVKGAVYVCRPGFHKSSVKAQPEYLWPETRAARKAIHCDDDSSDVAINWYGCLGQYVDMQIHSQTVAHRFVDVRRRKRGRRDMRTSRITAS
jgi:hypothetical protein